MYRPFKFQYLVVILLVCTTLLGCKDSPKEDTAENSPNVVLSTRFSKLLNYKVDSTAIPRSFDFKTNELRTITSKDWTSGFFPGSLWYLHSLTDSLPYKEKAAQWTDFIENEKFNNQTHDIGFMIYSSFGKGYEISNDKRYKDIILQTAKTLSTRYNSKVGAIRSWDWNKDIWEYPVIIDNMMNLELLFEATKLSKDSTYYKIADSHAKKTLEHHFRENHSTYHVVVYDTVNGKPLQKVTHQGISDQSSWTRGQAWAIYGFTMSYRYTKNESYLNQAENTFDFYFNHKNLPTDGIPYWDFDDPEIPNAPKDVSAAVIIASACFELFNTTQNKMYKDYADKVLKTLQSNTYLLSKDNNAPFILKHSTGNKPKNDEIEVAINYGDYYFLEALYRQSLINTQ